MLVYRVQNKYGNGPYAGSCTERGVYFQNRFKHCPFGQPVEGWDDEEIAPAYTRGNGDLRWAFQSIHQLRLWFDPFGREGYMHLRKFEYHIAIFEVPADRVWHYDAQITYDFSEATHVRDEELPCMKRTFKSVMTSVRAALKVRRECFGLYWLRFSNNSKQYRASWPRSLITATSRSLRSGRSGKA